MTEITLIRHGKPEFDLKGNARSREIKDIIRNYDLSGISEAPPVAAKEKAVTCKVAVCSDLYRSIESAKALGFKDIHKIDQVFREVATPHFGSGSFKMSVGAWAVLLRSMSVFGFSRNGESLSMAKKRAEVAASALIEISYIYESVLLVGHGFINYFIAKELLSRNWVDPKKPGGDYWEHGVYEYNAT
jgi:broad specificity phosphatase PhoE